MKYFHLKNIEMPWDDYGDILLIGITDSPGYSNLKLKLKRTGPYVPPMVIAGLDDLVVTDRVKQGLEASGLKGFSFSKVIKEHIPEVDWTAWDLQNDHPKFYPLNNDPENYILGLPHSQHTSEKMGVLWEVVLKENGTFINSYTYQPGNPDVDIMRTGNSGWILVTANGKSWIEHHCGNYVEFEEV